MDTLQDYIRQILDNYKLPATADDDFVDLKYETGLVGSYYVLHLSDLNIDPKYTAGATVRCRDFRCCHSYNGFVP